MAASEVEGVTPRSGAPVATLAPPAPPPTAPSTPSPTRSAAPSPSRAPITAEEAVVVTLPPPGPPVPERRPVQVWRWSLLALGLTAAGLRIATALGRLATADEKLWMTRSDGFSRAIADGDLAHATANIRALDTMPGVTTMWVGSAAKWVWLLGRGHGWWAEPDAPFVRSPSGLLSAQLAMAVATAALLVLVVVLVSWWVGRGAALAAGALLATEPFLVAHGAVMHTDELLSFFGAGALVATALALGVPSPAAVTARWWIAPLAGLMWAGTLLTKLSALLIAPAAGLLALWALVAALRAATDRRSRWLTAGRVLRTCGLTAVATLAAGVLAYPALWVNGDEETRAMWRSVNLGATGHRQFFMGEITDTPGSTFYAVALPLRMTPWFLAALALAVLVVLARRDLRSTGATLVLMALPVAVGISLASKQFDRYGLPLLVLAAIAVGVAVAGTVGRLRAPALVRATRVATVVVIGGLVAHSASLAPWGLAYFNPALGGAERAERTVLVGWGEGAGLAAEQVLELEGGRCGDVRVGWTLRSDGTPVPDVDGATYVAVYVNHRQRIPPARLDRLLVDRELVGTVERAGVDYVRIYGPPADPWAAALRLEPGERPAGGRLCDMVSGTPRYGP